MVESQVSKYSFSSVSSIKSTNVYTHKHTHTDFSCGVTFLLVEDQLSLELPPFIQGSLDLGRWPVARFWAVQEVTRAALLHEFGTGVTSELTETIRAVNDGVEWLHLGVSQNKVAVCKEREEKAESNHYDCVMKTIGRASVHAYSSRKDVFISIKPKIDVVDR